MVYNRYQIEENLPIEEKRNIMRNYLSFYEGLYVSEKETALNKKINRSIFNEVLDEIGNLLQKKASEMSIENTEIKSFLEKNPLPEDMEKHLPIEFRVFALLLNALKQWVSKESRYTDQYLLGGKAREICREAFNECMITGEKLGKDSELHHPIRDGRPPILLSKQGHETIERYYQRNLMPESELNEFEKNHWDKIQEIRKNRNQSWIQLVEGLENDNARKNAISFANKVKKETKLSATEIIELIEKVGIPY